MINLNTLGPFPVEVTTQYDMNITSRTGCDEGFAGAFSPQERPSKRIRVLWPHVTTASVAAFKSVLERTANGNVQVMVTPTMPDTKTLIGRLVGPFTIRRFSATNMSISAAFREDF